MSNIASLSAASKKLVFFGIYVINHLKDKGIIAEDFDALSLDASLVDSFDPASIQSMFKQKNKKNSVSLPVSPASRENVLNAVANEYYANQVITDPVVASDPVVSVVSVAAVAAVPVVSSEKPKRKYNKKSNAVVTNDVVVASDNKEATIVSDIVSDIIQASKTDLKNIEAAPTASKKPRKAKASTVADVTEVVDVAAVAEVAAVATDVTDVKEVLPKKKEVKPRKKAVKPITEEVVVTEVVVTEVVDTKVVIEEVAALETLTIQIPKEDDLNESPVEMVPSIEKVSKKSKLKKKDVKESSVADIVVNLKPSYC